MSSTQKLAPGMVLGRYELLLPIAQGGMATVWAARQKGSRGFQKTVAVKTMLPALSDDPQFEQMFLDEAQLASRIHHPNVAEILDLGEQDEILYLVMEWVDGEALSVLHKSAKKSETHLPQRIALRVVAQACAGLHAAHELKDENDQYLDLVHRDVSPQNILVTYDGIVKMVDFGVAKAIGRAGGETTAGQLKGKVPYMSPEQARGGKVDRRTDVFAMGIVLYKLTTGVHPFLGENDLVTMRNIISRPVMSPRVKNPDFSPELEQVLMTCLHKEPEKRFQTMADLDRAIDRVLAITGASVVDDDVGSFVRGIMGDRGQKRRAALRDAVRAADERAAGIASAPAPSAVVHEGVTDLLITRMASGVKEDMIPSSIRDAPVEPLPSSQSLTAVAGESVDLPGLRPRRRTLVVGAIATVAALLGVAVLVLQKPSASPAAVAPAAGAPGPVASTTASSLPSTEAPIVAVAPTASADTKPAIDLDDLPAGDDKGGDKPKKAGATHTKAAPTATAAAPPVRPNTWAPTVQNPGF
jgi:serine/threonine-protein kinase